MVRKTRSPLYPACPPPPKCRCSYCRDLCIHPVCEGSVSRSGLRCVTSERCDLFDLRCHACYVR